MAVIVLGLMTEAGRAQSPALADLPPQNLSCSRLDPSPSGFRAAERDGFTLLDFRRDDGSPEADLVRTHFVEPLERKVSERLRCGWDFALADLDGDGLDEVVLRVHWLPTENPRRSTTTLIVYTLGTDKEWRRMFETNSEGMGTRTTQHDGKPAYLLALVGDGGYVQERWKDGRFVYDGN